MAFIGLLEIFLAFIGFLLVRYYCSPDGYPINWPILGMIPDILLHLHRIHDRLHEVLELSGGNFLNHGPWFCNMEMLGTADPANINYIMSSNFSNYPKGHEFSEIFDILGDGIFNSDSDMWKNQRKLAHAMINHRRFHRFLVNASQDKVTNGLVPVLEYVAKQGFVLDLQDLFQRFTFDLTCILVTGYDPKCLSVEFPEVQFSKALDDAEEVLFYRYARPEWIWKLQRWMGVGQEGKMIKAQRTLDHIISKYIARKREEFKEKPALTQDAGGIDLLASYMHEAKVMGTTLDDKFLRDTILNFLIAGRDTTSSALTWFFWLVSNNPQVEHKIRRELQTTIPLKGGQKWRLLHAHELKNLVYLHGALCESLRLYPPVPFQQKASVEADVLPSGHRITPNMKIVFSLYALGRIKSTWGEDSLEFKPERWITEKGKIKHEPSCKFLAFNAGPRTCLGKEIAFTQMKLVAATIIHNYQVRVLEDHPVSPSNSVILHMKHGLKVRIAKRW
ncbi:hypothetical protein K2173_005213 [Erythroxylum novogranatense]|uniref:Alkane hydroxylase MAH1-like n=1 Tax=Erythroxylum novogranatense TaxID=1862640 RepID=A0AAV8TTP7_9ROSI|nr:hypothetical protein K2173_005213 [Erythroxylum novogranatense]